MAKLSPIVIIDRREQRPWTFCNLRSIPGSLSTGDYSVENLEHLIAVEIAAWLKAGAPCRVAWDKQRDFKVTKVAKAGEMR